MSSFVEYTTVPGDRWDSVAYKAYGDTFRIAEIAEANPTMRLYPVFPGGLVLKIPITESFSNVINPELLPLWKR